MKTLTLAFAAAIGSKNIKIARTLYAAHPLRRSALARKFGVQGVALDNATLYALATAAPVTVELRTAANTRASVAVSVATLAGMVQL